MGQRHVSFGAVRGLDGPRVQVLAAGLGSQVVLETDGPQETEALQALVALIEDKFGEGE